MKKVRILTLFLAILMLFMTACANKNDNDETQETTASQVSVETTASSVTADTSVGETTAEELKDKLPDDLNYGGKTINYLIRESRSYENNIAALNGEVTNDAIYNRNLAVSERLGVKFNFIEMDGVWGSTQQTNAIRNAVKAGTQDFDIISGAQAMMVPVAMEGNFANIRDLDYIDPEAPWWSKKLNDTMTIHDKLFITTGDCNITMWEAIYMMFFNKQMVKDYGLPDIYDLVKTGNWTLDKLTELSKNIYNDENGNGQVDEGDKFGFVTSPDNHMRAWMVTLNTPLGRVNDSGDIEICFYNERMLDAYSKLLALHYLPDSYINNKTIGDIEAADALKNPDIFTENRALFMTGFLKVSSIMRQTDCDFGIIPYPKYDTNQESYATTPHNSVSSICFLTNAPDLEMSSAVVEALCSQSYKDVTPAFYETVLKSKNATDEESSEMIDLLRDVLTFDVGWVHSASLGNLGLIYQDLIRGNIANPATYWKGKEKLANKNLADVNKTYANLG